MTRRRLALAVAGLAALVVLVVLPAAEAADVFGNVAPASQLPDGALTDRYPLGSYLLDHHFDAVKAGVLSGVDVSGIPPTIAWFLAQLFWQLTAFLANAVITLFTFAFSLDLVNGSSATGGNGALAPVSEAVRTIYRDVFGQAWMTVAVLIAGMWAIWNALVRRRYTETAGALATSVVFVTIALAFVTQPERTIGTASRWTNQMSGAFLSLSANGTVTDHVDAKRQVSDQLFKTLVYDPWVVLNFGGLEHCVRDAGSDDPVSVPVRPLSPNPARDAQLARQLRQGQQVEADGKVCVNNAAKYAPHFLRFPFESDQRNAEYEALKDGDSSKLPDEDPGKRDGTYRLSAVDKPAAEAMGKGGQYQRLGIAVVIFLGELGAFLLIGALSVAVILAQVLVLLLLAFAPIALVAAVIPRRGHDFFLGWLQRLATFLVRKAIYSLILAVLLAVAAALASAASNLGWLMAFGLQAVFYWTVFLYRRQLTGQLSHAVTGTSGAREEPRAIGGALALYASGRLLRRTLGRRQQSPTTDAAAPPTRPQLPPEPQQLPEPPAPPQRPPASDPPDDGPQPRGGGGRDDGDRPSAPSDRSPERAERHDSTAPGAPLLPPAAASPADGPERPASADGGARRPRPRRRARHAAPGARELAPHAKADADAGGGAAAAGERSTVPAPPVGREQPQEPPRAPAAAHAAAPSAGGEAARRTGESPLARGLRRDAQRLHLDAARLHRDAQQLGDTRDTDVPTRGPAPAPPVRRATPTAPPKGGESA
ncbi:MAG TPA: hypothetical protein VLK58_00520 [Conexibacter sp.]|nr:hypothetical protein [Conexibacter sp.]